MVLSFSGTLLRFVNYQKNITFEAETIRQAIAQLVEQYPQVRSVVYDNNGNVRRVHRIALDGELISPDRLDEVLKPDSRVQILTAIAGG